MSVRTGKLSDGLRRRSVNWDEAKILATVGLVLLAVEVGVRCFETSLSLDLAHLHAVPAIAAGLAEHEGPTVLFLGNSLVREGIDAGLVEQELAEHASAEHRRVRVARIHPDATHILEWRYLFERQFARPGRPLTVLAVAFIAGHLDDGSTVHARRLARYYTDWCDASELFRDEVKSFGDRIEYVMAKGSASFANHERVARRVLDAVVPFYRRGAQRLNQAVADEQRSEPVAAGRAPRSSDGRPQVGNHYRRLRSLVAAARANGTHVVLVAMPVDYEYAIDPELVSLADKEKITLVDGRHVVGIGPESFSDGLHMRPEAAAIFSRFVGEQFRDSPEIIGALAAGDARRGGEL